jgi:membrane protein
MNRFGKLAIDAAPLLMLAAVAVLGQQRAARTRQAVPGRTSEAGASPWRGLQPGRGRSAESPAQIPARGWKDILLRTRSEFSEDNIPMIAAGVTFYTLLALFPGLGALVSLYGLAADPADMARDIQTLAHLLPGGALKVLSEQMTRLASAQHGGLSLAFLGGLVAAVWSANGAVKALMIGMNVAYEEREKRSFLRKTLTSLAFTLGLMLFGILAIAVLGAGPAVEAYAGHRLAVMVQLVSWPLLVAGMGVGLALLYRYGPSRDPVKLKWLSWGSVAALLAWIVMSALFTLYVANFGHYDRTYGSLGAAIGFMVWLYLSAMVVLAGAELNSEIEHQTAKDTTVGHPMPMGARRARMADTVGAAQ